MADVQVWLAEIFPEGTNRRVWLINANAARSVYVMLYTLAIEGNDRWIAPKAVAEMSNRQAARLDLPSRVDYLERILRPRVAADGTAWLAPNSREGIRDEAIGVLKQVGAVIERDVPTTSPRGRYALRRDFAELFDPAFSAEQRSARIGDWRQAHLSREELARLAILATQMAATVTLPDGTTQPLTTGPSERIMKAVVEDFARRYLSQPVVLSYSDSGAPRRYVSDRLMAQLGLAYQAGDPLPDVMVADIAPPLRFVFVEVVATEGPMDTARVAAIRGWLSGQGFNAEDMSFVTAYHDRASAGYRATMSQIAWGTFVWFESEPDHLLIMSNDGGKHKLRELSDLIASTPA